MSDAWQKLLKITPGEGRVWSVDESMTYLRKKNHRPTLCKVYLIFFEGASKFSNAEIEGEGIVSSNTSDFSDCKKFNSCF